MGCWEHARRRCAKLQGRAVKKWLVVIIYVDVMDILKEPKIAIATTYTI